jgi:hypothetical protein
MSWKGQIMLEPEELIKTPSAINQNWRGNDL